MLQRRNKTNLVLDNISIDDSSPDGYIPEKPEEIPLLYYEVNEALLRQLLLVYGQYPILSDPALF